MSFEYKVIEDYHSSEWNFDLVKGDTVLDTDFPEPDIPSILWGKGILIPKDVKREAKRLASPPKKGK